MKALLFVSVFLFFGCKKNAADEGNGNRLQAITSGGKIYERFQYNENGLLVKEEWFSGCETTPMNEFIYVYNGTRPDTIKTVMRSLYSSTSALCDPAMGIKSYTRLEYDNGGRLIKETRANGSNSTYYYNVQGFVEKAVVNDGGNNNYTHTYKRDAAGNIIELRYAQGDVMQYEYDNKINPYYEIKKYTGNITAFNNSPNNVVKIKHANGSSEIRYEYNSQGLPVKMIDNGADYLFVYH